MSRIGRLPVKLPPKVEVRIEGNLLRIKGPIGEAEHRLPGGITAVMEGDVLRLERADDTAEMKRLHGVSRAHVANKVRGVDTGHSLSLIVSGKGYQGEVKGRILEMQVGFSHRLLFEIPKGLSVQVTPGQNTFTIGINGTSRDLVGAFAAMLYRIKPVEPYNLNGFRYSDQQVRRKATKTTKA